MIADKSYLEKYLEENPWSLQFSQERQVEYLFRFTTRLAKETVWKYISDTSSFNRRLGFSEVKFTEKEGRIYGKGRFMLKLHDWEEFPWQWEHQSYFRFSRSFSSGLLSFARVHVAITDSPDGSSDITIYAGLVPSHFLYRALFILLKKRFEKKIRRLIENLEEKADESFFYYLNPQVAQPGARAGKKERKKINREKLDAARRDILELGTPAPVAEALVNFISSAPDEMVRRIRPRFLASRMDIDPDTLIMAMMHSCRAGLLAMSWDIVCPHCREVKASYTGLEEITDLTSCGTCSIDFTPASENTVEITFSVSPEIRKVRNRRYCSAEPARKRHILLQKHLARGSKYLLTLPAMEKRLQFRIHGKKYYGKLDLKPDGQMLNLYWDDISANRIIEAGPGSTVFISNTEDEGRGYVIELGEPDTEALRPSSLFTMQEFRDFFPDERVAPGFSMDMGTQNLMFINVSGSTAFYKEAGDSDAFISIKKYLSSSHHIARQFGGAVIKTSGDSILLAFSRPMDAVRAGIRILRNYGGSGDIPLSVKISLHRGRCIAVNKDSAIDFFGHAVNVAEKLQNTAGGGEMLLSEPFCREQTVAVYLAEKGYSRNYASTGINGAGEVRYLKIRVRKG